MKNSQQCPKCKSADIIRIPGMVASYGVGNAVLAGSTISSAVKVSRYLCGQCGYSEEWIDSQEDIVKIKKKYSQPR
jgi:hypothetical protein